jgi:hypothetical protein
MRGDGKDPGDVCVVEHARHPNPGPDGPGQVNYSSGTRVGVALVRISFLKNARRVTRQ